jgi:Putative viral replication protein./RNA helicase.
MGWLGTTPAVHQHGEHVFFEVFYKGRYSITLPHFCAALLCTEKRLKGMRLLVYMSDEKTPPILVWADFMAIDQPVQGRGSRGWCFTDYSLNEDALQACESRYLIYGRELCPKTGRTHLQGFVYFDNVIARKTVQERLNVGKCHCKPMYSTPDACIAYCKKDGESWEQGDRPAQGKKCDKEVVKTMAIERTPIRRVLENTQATMHSIRTVELMYRYFEGERDWKTDVYWFWGSPEAGKTRKAIAHAKENYGDVYMATDTSQWFDGYDAHQAIIVDDFTEAWITWKSLLKFTDRYGFRLAYKGGFRQCLAKAIYFTSIDPPEASFPTLNYNEPIVQFLRRLTHSVHVPTPLGEELSIEKCLKDKRYIYKDGILQKDGDETIPIPEKAQGEAQANNQPVAEN